MEKVVIGTGPSTEVLIGRPSGSVGEKGVHLKLNGSAGSYTLEHRPADSGGFIPIGSYAEFQLISTDAGTLARNYKQEADLDLLGDLDGDGTFGETGDEEWTAIGDGTNKFTGTFDGDNKDIRNIYINKPSVHTQGLFGYVMDSTISNVRILSGTVIGNDGVGGVVAYNKSGRITNCFNSGRVRGNTGVAGIVASNADGVITDCFNSGAVTGNTYTGGVAGTNSPIAIITGCSNSGNVGATSIYSGGVVASNSGTVTNSSNNNNNSNVTGKGYLGGVAGYNGGTITGCSNSGDVTSTAAGADVSSLVGGVVGLLSNNGRITGCSNSGTIRGEKNNVGGIVGIINTGAVIDCSNSGDLYGNRNVGGIMGSGEGSIIKCSNRGTITGSGGLGGVAGNAFGSGKITASYNNGDVIGSGNINGGVAGCSPKITACYNTGTVSGTTEIGGVVGANFGGNTSPGTVTASYNSGTVTGNSNFGGVVGNNNFNSATGTVTTCYWQSGKGASDGIGYTGSGIINGLASFSGNADFPNLSGNSAWGTGTGSGASQSPPDSTTNDWWKPGTTNGGQLPKLWFEK
jgi:hypothetical protein